MNSSGMEPGSELSSLCKVYTHKRSSSVSLSRKALNDPNSLGLSDPVYGSIGKLGIDERNFLDPLKESISPRGNPFPVFSNNLSPFATDDYGMTQVSSVSGMGAQLNSLKSAQRELMQTHEQIRALEREIRSARLGKY